MNRAWVNKAFPPRVLKILEGTALAAAGAAITYLGSWVGMWDLGTWTPLVTTAWAAFVQAARHAIASWYAEQGLQASLPGDPGHPVV